MVDDLQQGVGVRANRPIAAVDQRRQHHPLIAQISLEEAPVSVRIGLRAERHGHERLGSIGTGQGGIDPEQQAVLAHGMLGEILRVILLLARRRNGQEHECLVRLEKRLAALGDPPCD